MDTPSDVRNISRRRLLVGSALFTLAATSAVVAACGGQPAQPTAPPAAPAQPAAQAPAAQAPAAVVQPTTAPAAQAAAQPSKGPLSLQFYGGWTGPDGLVMKKMVDQHNKEVKDAQVTLSIYDWDTMFAKMVAAYAAKSPPDIAGAHMKDVPDWVNRGMIVDLDPLVKEGVFPVKDYIPFFWKRASGIDGKVYMMPLDHHPKALYLNVDLFQKEGIDVVKNPPKTQEQFIEYAKKATKTDSSGRITQSGFGVGYGDWSFYTVWWAGFKQRGGHFLAEDMKKSAFNNQIGLEAAQFAQDLIYKYKVTPQGILDQDKEFKTSKAAMIYEGPWDLSALGGFETVKGLNFTTASIPEFGKQMGTWAASHCLYLLKSGHNDKIEAGGRFMKWMSDHTGTPGWADAGHVPIRTSILESAEFKKLPNRAPFVASSAYEDHEPFPLTRYHQIFVYTKESPFLDTMQKIARNKPVADSMKSLAGFVDTVLSAP